MPHHRVLIGCAPELQSHNTGLDVARRLVSLEHHVTFVGLNIDEFRGHVEANGFEFVGLGRSLAGLPEELQRANALRRVRLIRARMRELQRAVADFGTRYAGQFQLLLLDTSISDGLVSYVGISAGIPIILFCSGYTSRSDPRYPPAYFCDRIPRSINGTATREQLVNLLCWATVIFRRLVRKYLYISPSIVFLAVLDFQAWNYRRLARRLGARFCFGDWGIRLEAPEIALAIKSIDWPQLQRSNTRLYMNRDSVSRNEFRDTDWRAGIDLEKPLVYCSMGALIRDVWKDHSKAELRPGVVKLKRYLDIVIAGVAGRSDWQLVIAAGHLDEAFEQTSLPPNVRILRWVPQDDVLRHAAVMITAGGSATLRDCVFFGVPMVVVPLWSDHFGNAARVVFHKLGYKVRGFRN